ncbi:MAG TPA: DUF6034 family protein [Clostridia bacterium]|nr:DUF6034 family protein [Clostridia bacterium]
MKKRIVFALAALFLLTACQATPEADIVVQKNTEQMIEAAKETPEATADKTLAELYGIPEGLSFTDTGADGKLTITVEATVSAPEKPLPIVRVEAAQFSQETVTMFWNAFLGDTPMMETVYEQTKADIEESILYYKQVQAGSIDGMMTPEEAQEYIDELEARYASAPDSMEPIPADGMLKTVTEDFSEIGGHGIAHYEGIDAMSEDGAYYFSVRNDRDNTEPISWSDYNAQGKETGSTTVPVSRGANLSCTYDAFKAHYINVGNSGRVPLRVDRTDALPREATALLKLTPAEAAQSVEAFLRAAGIGETMGISDIFLINDKEERNGRPEATGYAYNVVCMRLAGGIPGVYLPNAHTSGGGAKTEFAPSWGYEELIFLIGDEGILSVNWYAPVKITETVSDAATLKSFSEIAEIAKKMFAVKYEPEAKNEHILSLEITVDRVTLSLQRVAEQDRFDHGLLVPVWNFFGVYTAEYSGEGYVDVESGSLLSINAINGSIIDPELGY